MTGTVALAPGEHAVQFYESDADLVPAVLAPLVSAFDAGRPVVLVATAEHRAAFEAGLRARAVDVPAAASAARLAVGDSRPVAPTPRDSGIDEPHGRGLVLVGGMSARWGHAIVADGKLVWAELVDEPGLGAR